MIRSYNYLARKVIIARLSGRSSSTRPVTSNASSMLRRGPKVYAYPIPIMFRVRLSTAPAVARTYERNGLNRYTSVDGVNFSYDGRGNLTSDGSRTFAYDLENRLASVSGSASMALVYDPLGRIRQSASGGVKTQFLYDGDRLVAEHNESGTLLRRYVHGAGVDEPVVWYEGSNLSDARHLMTDERGSIIVASGASTTRHAYGPYGEPDTWTGPRFRYTGQAALPEVQLYHYKARVYDPMLGRFLQTDPIGYEDDLNLYGYVANDPVNNTDPTGMICTATSAATSDTPATAICQNASDLNLSGNGAKNIIGYEGVSATAYQVGSGIPTIGIGHTAGVQMGDTMSSAEIQGTFMSDVGLAEGFVENLVGNLPVSQQEFDAHIMPTA